MQTFNDSKWNNEKPEARAKWLRIMGFNSTVANQLGSCGEFRYVFAQVTRDHPGDWFIGELNRIIG